MFFRLPSLFLLGIIITTTSFLPSCSRKVIPKEALSVVKLNLADDPMSWDPRCVRLIKDTTLLSHLYEGLTRYGSSDPENGLAETIFLSEDRKNYIICLKNAFWSNGEPITAYDVLESWLQVLDSNFPSFYSYFMDVIKNGNAIRRGELANSHFGVKVLSEKVFSVELEQPYSFFKELLALPVFFPVHESLRHAFAAGKKEHSYSLISSGAFKLHLWNPKSSVKLVKNSLYWESEKVHLEEIEMSIITDPHTEALLFEKGLLDWMGQPWSVSILSEFVDKLEERDLFRSYEVNGTFGLLINTKTFPLNNVKLRQALACSINKKDLIQFLLKGHQRMADFLLPASLYSEAFVNSPLYRSTARSLFQEALKEMGITLENFPKITIVYPSSLSRCSLLVQEIQQQWKKHLGITVDIRGYEYRQFLEKREQGKYDIATVNWFFDIPDPLLFLRIFSDKEGFFNYIRWENSDYSRLLDTEAYKLLEKEQQQLFLEKAQRILTNEVPFIPLYHHSMGYVVSPRIKNIMFRSSGIVDLKYIKLD